MFVKDHTCSTDALFPLEVFGYVVPNLLTVLYQRLDHCVNVGLVEERDGVTLLQTVRLVNNSV